MRLSARGAFKVKALFAAVILFAFAVSFVAAAEQHAL